MVNVQPSSPSTTTQSMLAPPGVSTVWQCSVVGPSGSTPQRRTTGARGVAPRGGRLGGGVPLRQPVAERVGHRQDDARAHRLGRVRGHVDGHRDRAAAEGHDAGDGDDQEQSSADPGHRVTVTRGPRRTSTVSG